MEEDSAASSGESAEGDGIPSASSARSRLPRPPLSINALPFALFDMVFSFLPVADLRTVLGVNRHFYRAAVESDPTVWRDACLALWKSKQGFRQISSEWPAIAAAGRSEELFMIAMQQCLIARKHFGLGTVCYWDALAKDDEKRQRFASVCRSSQEFAPSSCDSHHCPPWWSRQQSLNRAFTTNANVFAGVCEDNCVVREPQHMWDSAASVRTAWRTTTCDAIRGSGCTSCCSTSSCATSSSRFLPVALPPSPLCNLGEHDSTCLCANASAGPRLYCCQFAQDTQERQQQRIQRHGLCKQEQQSEKVNLLSFVGGDDEKEAEKSTNFNSFESTCPGLTSVRASPFSSSLQSDTEVSDDSENNNTGLHSVIEKIIHNANISDGSCGDLEEVMNLTRSLSLMLYSHYNRHTMEYKSGAATHKNSPLHSSTRSRGNTDTSALNPCCCPCALDTQDDAALTAPVSWRYAYHMSLRDARRVRLRPEDLFSGRWFVCFRATGRTHAASFAPDHALTLTVRAAGGGGGEGEGREGSGEGRGGNGEGRGGGGGAYGPRFACRLLRGGAQLAVHNFPPLAVRRRSARAADGGRGKEEKRARAGNAGDEAFDAEPDATVRRWGLRGNAGDDEDAEDDWGWVAQNYFVKIFSVETPLPLYGQRLRSSYKRH